MPNNSSTFRSVPKEGRKEIEKPFSRIYTNMRMDKKAFLVEYTCTQNYTYHVHCTIVHGSELKKKTKLTEVRKEFRFSGFSSSNCG